MERLNWHIADELSRHAQVRIIGPQGSAALRPAAVPVIEVPLRPLPRFLLASAWQAVAASQDQFGLKLNPCPCIYTQFAYTSAMKAVFVELPAFARHRANYLSDDGFRDLQATMMKNPEAGDVIEGTGGLRKLRHSDSRRGKGKRAGLRVIYYWWDGGPQFWLFTLYGKDEMTDLSPDEKKALKNMLKIELEARR